MTTLKELQVELEKLDRTMSRLSTKADSVQKKMESGDYGTHQVNAMNKELDKILLKMSEVSAKKLTVQTTINTRDFDILNKQIATIQDKLLRLGGLKDLKIDPNATKGFNDGLVQAQTHIKNLENALKSLESRKWSQFDSSGQRVGSNVNGSFGGDDFDKRLGPLPQQEQYGDADLSRRVSPYTTISKGSSPAGGSTDLPVDKINDFESQFKTFDENAKKAIRGLNKMGVSLSEFEKVSTSAEGISEYAIRGKQNGESLKKNARLFVDEMGNWGRDLGELKHMKLVNDPTLKNVHAEAAKYGFQPENVKNSFQEAGGAYRQTQYSRTNEYGREDRLRLRSDQYGGVNTAPVQKASQSFSQGITKDLGDLIKWSIAISAIYGPINAITAAMGELIENESKLADVSIALNSGLADTGKIFDDVYNSAKASGESVSGVIDAFGQAYTATSRVDGQANRYHATLGLLSDSLTLSKLSTLDQAGAIDVLTAALYQVGPANESANDKLARGQELIDKWVRVSKFASVSVETLATGVAVLGDTAETAGLSMEQLNALVATIAETSLSSGKETANIAKALVGNFQQDSAAKELGRLGIATTDVTGKTRQFLDVMREVAAMRENGSMGDQDFSRLTMALGGGGVRRQADVARFIENMGRMNQLVGIQEGAGGDAADAMAVKLETVQTSSTNLANAFTSLAQSMGNEGGLLSVFSSTIDMGTLLVEVMDSIASATGKVAPLLLGLGVGSVLLRGRGLSGITNSLALNTGMNINAAGLMTGASNPFDMFINRNIQAQYGANNASVRNNRFTPGSMLGNATSLPSLAAIALPAMQNAAGGDYEEAGANIAGGIAGALIAGPVGALIGSAIAEAFVRTTLTYETSFVAMFEGVNKAVDENNPEESGRSAEDSRKAVGKAQPLGAVGLWGGYVADVGINAIRSSFMENYDNLLAAKNGETDLKTGVSRSVGGTLQNLGGIFSAMFEGKSDVTGAFANRDTMALEQLKITDPEEYKRVISEGTAAGINVSGEQTSMSRQQEEFTNRDGGYLTGAKNAGIDEITKQLIEGDIKAADFANKMNLLSGYETAATSLMAALVDETGKLPEEWKSSQTAYEAYLEIAKSGNQELINQINQQKTSISYYEDNLKTFNPDKPVPLTDPTTGEKWTPDNAGQIQDKIDAGRSGLALTTQYASEQAALQRLQNPNVFGSMSEASFGDKKELTLVEEATRKDQERFYQYQIETGKMTAEQYEALKKSWEGAAVAIEKSGGDVFYDKIKDGLDPKIFSENYKEAQDSGLISGSSNKTPWSTSGATKAQIKQAEAQAPAYVAKLEAQGYESEITDAIYSTKDEQIVKSHGDQKVIQYLLQQILDTEKKQLQGVYNLPEGASAYVPLQAAELAGGGGTGDGTSTGDVTASSLKTSEIPYSQIPGEELTMYGYSSLKDMMSQMNSYKPLESILAPTEPLVNEVNPPKLESVKVDHEADGMGKIPNGTGTDVGAGIMAALSQFLEGLKQMQNPLSGSGDGVMSGKDFSGRSPIDQASNSQTIQTKLDLKLTSTTQLIVDGRMLAQIVKPYLAGDLLKTNESGGTVTRSYVI